MKIKNETPGVDIPIEFEDEDIVIINKPAGIVVNRAESVKSPSIQDWADAKIIRPPADLPPKRDPASGRKNNVEEFINRSGVVHRIDKETSGIMLIAKNPAAFVTLQDQFKRRIVQKTYIALVHGKVVTSKGSINAPIGRLPWNRKHFGILPGGKEAQTDFTVTDVYQHKTEYFTLLKLTPLTGRTHQIRVHLKYLGNSVVSDPLYAGRKLYRADKRWCPRLFLHAAAISFTHPQTNQLLSFTSLLPPDLDTALKTLDRV